MNAADVTAFGLFVLLVLGLMYLLLRSGHSFDGGYRNTSTSSTPRQTPLWTIETTHSHCGTCPSNGEKVSLKENKVIVECDGELFVLDVGKETADELRSRVQHEKEKGLKGDK